MADRLEGILSQTKNDYVLPPAVADEWKQCCQGIVQMNVRLAHHYHPRKIMLFHFTIKFHMLCHLALLGKGLNPRLAWCYSGEKDDAGCQDSCARQSFRIPTLGCGQQSHDQICQGLGLALCGRRVEEVSENMSACQNICTEF